MSKRKLRAIGYEKDFIDFEDDNAYRAFVCDIERRYLRRKDDAWVQAVLAKDKPEQWAQMLQDYFVESGFCSINTRAAAADSLLSAVAVKMFDENADAQRMTGSGYLRLTKPKAVDHSHQTEELGSLVSELCKLLKITYHPNPMVSLEAACIYINRYLNKDFVQKHNAEVNSGVALNTFDLKSFPSGLPDSSDPIINVAARLLRLLNIETLRDTQTAVNETLVQCQNITAEKSA